MRKNIASEVAGFAGAGVVALALFGCGKPAPPPPGAPAETNAPEIVLEESEVTVEPTQPTQPEAKPEEK